MLDIQKTDAHDLAALLKVPVSWVREQTRKRATDPIPHLRMGRYVRFEIDSPAFGAWLQRHRKGTR